MYLPILEATMLLLVLVLVSNVISHYLVSIPTALIQVGVGIIVALVADIQIELESSWFMLLFIAPLLFNDGKHYPNKELWKLRAPIFANAILLVFIITFLGGFMIHTIVPEIPLVVSFALAAILAPTDTVAVHGIAERVKLPPGILSLVTGESLINDASGLIAFKYAIAATVTGFFSFKNATLEFFYMAIVGGIIGFILMLLIHLMKIWLMKQGITDVILHTSIQIIAPFLIYFIAEDYFHASGVIAVVAAGLVASTKKNFAKDYLAEIHMLTERTWDIIIYLLNGIVFLILGIEFPVAMKETIQNPLIGNIRAIGYTILIWLMLLAIRIIWIYGYMLYAYSFGPQKGKVKPSFYIALLSGLTGVRGAITMAGILSIPHVIDSGAIFPERSLVLFIASGVILLSLLAATIALPLLTKQKKRIEMTGDEPGDAHSGSLNDLMQNGEISETKARMHLMKLAIQTLEKETSDENRLAAYDLIHEYNHLIRHLQIEQNSKEDVAFFIEKERSLRKMAFESEQVCLEKLKENQEASAFSLHFYEQALERKMKLSNMDFRSKFTWLSIYLQRKFRRVMQLVFKKFAQKKSHAQIVEILAVEKECAKAAIRDLSFYLKVNKKDISRPKKSAIYHLIVEYRNKIERIKQYGHLDRRAYEEDVHDLRLKVLASERANIQKMYENGDISRELAARLRQFVNYSEGSIMEVDFED